MSSPRTRTSTERVIERAGRPIHQCRGGGYRADSSLERDRCVRRHRATPRCSRAWFDRRITHADGAVAWTPLPRSRQPRQCLPATQSRRATEQFTTLNEEAGWAILPEVVSGTRAGRRLLAAHYPSSGDKEGQDRHATHRPIDEGSPLIHGHTHGRENGPLEHQFHVDVDAFGFAPVPMTLINAWLEDLRREEEEIATIVRGRSAAGPSTPLSEVADRLGVNLDEL